MCIIIYMLNTQILISNIADIKIILPLLLMVSLLHYIFKKKKSAYIIAISSISASFIAFILKKIFYIPRPSNSLIIETGSRFPSGHATINMVLIGLIIYFTFKHIKNKPIKYIISIISIFWFIIISYSRLYLGVHYIIDIIVGGIIGIISIVIALKFIKKL